MLPLLLTLYCLTKNDKLCSSQVLNNDLTVIYALINHKFCSPLWR
jgi:hypothetical protein